MAFVEEEKMEEVHDMDGEQLFSLENWSYEMSIAEESE